MLFFNEDWTHFLWSRFENKIELNEQVLKDFIYQYKGTKITDFCLNVNGSISSAKSEIFETFAQKYLASSENGEAVDYKNTYAKAAYDLEQAGLDQYKIWVDSLREIGIRPWISIRMNDCHDNYKNAGLRKSSDVEKHPEFWRIKHRDADEYFDKTFDYEVPAVRQKMLSYIKEMLENYSPDGLELDFTRESDLVEIGKEYDSFSLITSFIGEVKLLCEKQSEKTGKKIKIGVLLGANITATFNSGFDVKEWCDNSLVDFVTILPRWRTINTNMDIGLWKRLVTNGAKLGTGLQLLVKPVDNFADKMALVDHDFGQAVANLTLGADYIYLYNHFDTLTSDIFDAVVENSVREPENLKKILNNIDSLDTALNFKRRHILTFDDYAAAWDSAPARLPLTLQPWFSKIRIAVGKIIKGSNVELILGFTEKINPNELEIYLNSTKINFKCEGGRYDGEDYSYTFSVPDGIINTYAIIELKSKSAATLNFAEIVVER